MANEVVATHFTPRWTPQHLVTDAHRGEINNYLRHLSFNRPRVERRFPISSFAARAVAPLNQLIGLVRLDDDALANELVLRQVIRRGIQPQVMPPDGLGGWRPPPR